MIFCTTPRLVLRSLEARDVPALREHLSDWELVKWMSTLPFPFEEEDACALISEAQTAEAAGKPAWLVLARPKEDDLMGLFGVTSAHNIMDEGGDYELTYWMGRKFWHKGYMLEAVKAGSAWAKAQNWIKRVVAATDSKNDISQEILKKSGFVFQELRPRIMGRGSPQVTYWIYEGP
jgi:8-oxo-dGTP diphosphatase